MALSTLRLDEESELEFSMEVFGTTEPSSDIRFVIENDKFDISLKAKEKNGDIIVKIPKLKGIVTEGEHNCRVEVVIDDKMFIPLEDSIEFEPLGEVAVEEVTIRSIKESVAVKAKSAKPAKTKIQEAREQGFDVVKYNDYSVLKKDDKFYGFVTESKILKVKKPTETIIELVRNLEKK